MQHRDVLTTCVNTLADRAASYGNEDDLFNTAAQIASLLIGVNLSKYDISVVMESVKLARRRFDPLNEDSYVDQINYCAFSAQFAREAFNKATQMVQRSTVQDPDQQIPL
jgi:hypothetical protein